MSTVKTLLIGVTVGAVLGVLYAPDRGSVTRRKLSRKGEDLRDSFNDLRDNITSKLDNFKDDMNEMAYQEMDRIEGEASAGRESWQS